MEMNKILTAALFVVSASLITLSVDGLMPGAYLNSHKFTADLLICNANLFSMVIWFLLIMIFHPRHGYGGVETTSSFNTTSGQARTHVIDGTHFVVPVNDNNTHLNGQSTGYIPYNVNDIAQYIESPSPPTTPKYQTYATNPPPKSPKSPQRPMSPARKGPSSENPNNAWGETRPLATDQGVELYSANSDSSLPRRPCSPVVTVPRPLSSTSGTYRPRAEDISMQTIMFDDEYEMPPARQ
ncbi:hypothetical protein BC937DRAFT_89177 [Endogone sp. FLAS-F59071]|nr:hypothetical protein BC937DRAFT_89177 [Endogone sp. FLAS-F59071]|eukprot:RUS18069.1 hypothetical protein BC937DRAFT_89177 [Endogone sp. FLAS-F59071]